MLEPSWSAAWLPSILQSQFDFCVPDVTSEGKDEWPTRSVLNLDLIFLAQTNNLKCSFSFWQIAFCIFFIFKCDEKINFVFALNLEKENSLFDKLLPYLYDVS